MLQFINIEIQTFYETVNNECRMSNVEGMYSIFFNNEMERSLRLVGVLTPTPRRAIPSFEIRYSLFDILRFAV